MDEKKIQQIELDCPPGLTRPDTLLPSAIKNTNLSFKDPVNKSFGCWTYDYSEIDPKEWEQYVPKLQENITKLYNAGKIRYGAWS